jgi:prepilin-type N-terminal cleavage/methylation domain-containing protein
MNAEFRQRRREGGFTLIETIITLVVLSIAVVGVLSVFITGIKGSANPALAGQATQLAQGELDAVVGIKAANGFSDSALNAGTGLACKTATSMLPGFTCSLNICYVPAGNLNDTTACNAPTNYKHVTVTITQTTIGSVSADTLLTNY